jgi:hypothetical protein
VRATLPSPTGPTQVTSLLHSSSRPTKCRRPPATAKPANPGPPAFPSGPACSNSTQPGLTLFPSQALRRPGSHARRDHWHPWPMITEVRRPTRSRDFKFLQVTPAMGQPRLGLGAGNSAGLLKPGPPGRVPGPRCGSAGRIPLEAYSESVQSDLPSPLQCSHGAAGGRRSPDGGTCKALSSGTHPGPRRGRPDVVLLRRIE